MSSAAATPIRALAPPNSIREVPGGIFKAPPSAAATPAGPSAPASAASPRPPAPTLGPKEKQQQQPSASPRRQALPASMSSIKHATGSSKPWLHTVSTSTKKPARAAVVESPAGTSVEAIPAALASMVSEDDVVLVVVDSGEDVVGVDAPAPSGKAAPPSSCTLCQDPAMPRSITLTPPPPPPEEALKVRASSAASTPAVKLGSVSDYVPSSVKEGGSEFKKSAKPSSGGAALKAKPVAVVRPLVPPLELHRLKETSSGPPSKTAAKSPGKPASRTATMDRSRIAAVPSAATPTRPAPSSARRVPASHARASFQSPMGPTRAAGMAPVAASVRQAIAIPAAAISRTPVVPKPVTTSAASANNEPVGVPTTKAVPHSKAAVAALKGGVPLSLE